MPSLIFSKVGQWTRFEFLLSQIWSSGLMFNPPVLEDDLMFHCSSFSLVVTLGVSTKIFESGLLIMGQSTNQYHSHTICSHLFTV